MAVRLLPAATSLLPEVAFGVSPSSPSSFGASRKTRIRVPWSGL
jgi:hypothetical protein